MLVCAVLSVCASARAATLPAGFAETAVVTGLSSPTAMAFAPDGRAFVCLQGGSLRVVKNGALLLIRAGAVCIRRSRPGL